MADGARGGRSIGSVPRLTLTGCTGDVLRRRRGRGRDDWGQYRGDRARSAVPAIDELAAARDTDRVLPSEEEFGETHNKDGPEATAEASEEAASHSEGNYARARCGVHVLLFLLWS